MHYLNKILFVIGEKYKSSFYVLIIINILNFFLEFFSLISIPIFVTALLGEEISNSKFKIQLSFFSNENFLIYSSTFLVTVFLIKNFLLSYNAYYQAKFLKNVRSNLSKNSLIFILFQTKTRICKSFLL